MLRAKQHSDPSLEFRSHDRAVNPPLPASARQWLHPRILQSAQESGSWRACIFRFLVASAIFV
jgi:hypothetical protein